MMPTTGARLFKIITIMTLDFINKRIKEQEEHLHEIVLRYSDEEFDFLRYDELWNSAKSQLDYFEQKKKEIVKKRF